MGKINAGGGPLRWLHITDDDGYGTDAWSLFGIWCWRSFSPGVRVIGQGVALGRKAMAADSSTVIWDHKREIALAASE